MLNILDGYTVAYIIGYVFTFWLFARRNFYNFFYIISLTHLKDATSFKDYENRCNRTRHYINKIGYIRVGLVSLLWPFVLTGSILPLWLDKKGVKEEILRKSRLTIN